MTQNKIILLSLLVFSLIYPYKAGAIPATPHPVTIVQPDNSALTLYITGDEHFHFRTTTDGYLVQQAADEYYYYSETDAKGGLQLSTVKATDKQNRSASEQSFLSGINKEEIIKNLYKYNSLIAKTPSATNAARIGSFPTEGEPHSLVILAEFSDVFFTGENPIGDFSNMLNQSGYSINGATGSVRDYLAGNSSGKFLPTFDVYGPVRLPNPVSYYGANNQYGQDVNNRQMIIDACEVLYNSGQIDFSDYDTDNNGIVDNIYVFYAGYAESDGGPSYTIWPHAWDMSELNIIYNNVQLGTYACSSELVGGTGNTMAPIGAFTHEFMHVLGLPDLYETNYYTQYCFTPGAYSVLASGPYNNQQRTPPHLSAYERYSLGWLSPIEITGAANIHILPVEENEAYIIRCDNPDEYFIFENRQPDGWDAYLPGHGMLIWHIDYDKTLWDDNEVNNDPNHQRVDLIEADNIRTDSSRTGDTFPGTAGVTSFTATTTPSFTDWNGAAIGLPLTRIIETEATIHFRVSGGKDLQGKVSVLPAVDISQTSFVAHWESFADAWQYKLWVYTLDAEQEPLYVSGYNGRVVPKDKVQLLIEGLEPGTEYRYTVAAVDGYSQTEVSDEISVETAAATFEYLIPQANPATDISENGFTANWEKLSGANAYYLDVFQKAYTPAESVITIDFVNKINGIPADWDTNCTSTTGSAGYYGESTPALRMDMDGQYIQSPVFENNIFSLSFWYRSSNAAPANAIIIYGDNGTQWIKLKTINPLATAEGGETITLDADGLEGYPAVKILFRKGATGYVAVDDIKIESGFETQIDYLPGYAAANMGDALSEKITGLEENQYYYYTIMASDGIDYTRKSSPTRVYTRKGSAIDNPINNNPFIVSATGKSIEIQARNQANHSLILYNLMGKPVYSDSFIGTKTINIENIPAGVYILTIDKESYKILLRN